MRSDFCVGKFQIGLSASPRLSFAQQSLGQVTWPPSAPGWRTGKAVLTSPHPKQGGLSLVGESDRFKVGPVNSSRNLLFYSEPSGLAFWPFEIHQNPKSGGSNTSSQPMLQKEVPSLSLLALLKTGSDPCPTRKVNCICWVLQRIGIPITEQGGDPPVRV